MHTRKHDGKSVRRTKRFGITTAQSEKQDKRLANRRFRRQATLAVLAEREPPHRIEETSNVYSFAKDGRQYWAKAQPKDMRK